MIRNRKGFSLIELVLAMAILAILASSSTVILTAALRSTERALLTTQVRREGTYIIDSMSHLVRFSPQVTCITSGENVGDMQVASTNPGVEDALFSCDYDPITDSRSIASGSATINPQPIHSPDVDITGCSFVCLSGGRVQINYTIRDKDDVIVPIDFSTEIVLRNAQ